MKITVTLIARGFFFFDGMSLSSAKPTIEIDLDDKTDQFIATVITSVLYAKTKIDKDLKNIVPLIKDAEFRTLMAKKAGVTLIETVVPVVVAPVIPKIESVVAKVEAVPAKAEAVVEAVKALPTQADLLVNILEDGAKKVVDNLAVTKLSSDDISALLKFEIGSKNRPAVVATLQAMVGK